MARIFIGYDSNEVVAYNVFAHSLNEKSTGPLSVSPLNKSHMEYVFRRERSPLQSTEFSFTRFLVPFLSGYEGWSIFADCDFLCRADIHELWKLRDDRCAVMVCKHEYTPKEDTKFLNAIQTKYKMKNWSSLIMFNNARCRRLTPKYVNEASGLDLHQFKWLDGEHEIGGLPLEWNWLVGVYGGNPNAKMVHFTIGGPYFTEYRDCDYSDEWFKTRERMLDVTQKADLSKVVRA